MSRKLLSLVDLYEFYCKQNKSVKFSAMDTDASIVVHIEEPFIFEASESEDNDQMRVNLRLCHSQRNLNSSFIDDAVLEKAIPSAYNMPILGYIWKDDNDISHFAGHEFYINEDGEYVYEEIPVGCIPESADLKLVQYDGDDRKYLEGQGCIWKEYSDAADILEREKNLSVSVELEIRDLAFNAADKVMVINDFIFTAVTILGVDPKTGEEVRPGMENSCVSINSLEDFSKKENSLFSKEIKEKLVELENKINDLSNFNIKNTTNKKGGEILEKEFETEDVVVDTEVQEEAVEEIDKDTTAGETSTEETVEEATEEFSEETESDEAEEIDNSEKEAEDNSETEEASEDVQEEVSEVLSEGVEEKFTKTFELSHDDIKVGLYNLLAPFEDEDNDWYGIVNVFDDYFIYQGYFDPSNCYKQGYSKEGDSIQFSGERIHMNAEYLTDNELAELNVMRSNYSEISEKLAKYEAEPQKIEKIESDEYAMIRDTEEFKAIESDHFDLSVEEITKALDDAVLKYAKANKLNYSAKKDGKVERKLFSTETSVKTGKYDSLFKK